MKITNQLLSFNQNQRIILLYLILVFSFVVIALRSFYLQVWEYGDLRKMADKQQKRMTKVRVQRGAIYDSRGNLLAASIPMKSVFAVPDEIDDPYLTAEILANVLDISVEEILNKLGRNNNFTWIERYISPRRVKRLKEVNIPGIHLMKEYQRFYPEKVASQLVGFTGDDSKGLEGLEYAYHDYLMGKKSESFLSFSSLNEMDFHGDDLYLTIHNQIQFYTEKELKKGIDAMQANFGVAIVMDSKTGAVYSMASIPDYDPNRFAKYPTKNYFNRAIGDAYEPGSTFKIITIASAIELGIINGDELFFCENGKYKIQDRVIHDIRPYQYLNIQQVIQKSSNICAVKIGQLMQKSKFYEKILDFGFGSKSDLELPGESSGIVHHFQDWSETDLATISYGHSIAATPIQIISAINTIANKGRYVSPRVIQERHFPNLRKAQKTEKQTKYILKPKTAKLMREYMTTVTQRGGTGYLPVFKKYPVAGKTGTSRKLNRKKGEYSSDRHLSFFAGFYPIDDPEITILVVIDEPQKRYKGGFGATPVFGEILKKTIHVLGNHESVPKTDVKIKNKPVESIFVNKSS